MGASETKYRARFSQPITHEQARKQYLGAQAKAKVRNRLSRMTSRLKSEFKGLRAVHSAYRSMDASAQGSASTVGHVLLPSICGSLGTQSDGDDRIAASDDSSDAVRVPSW